MMVLPNVQSPLVGPARQAAMNLLSFLSASPTPFHAVKTAADKLEAAGFKKVSEQDSWEDTIVEGGRYYFTRLAQYISIILPTPIQGPCTDRFIEIKLLFWLSPSQG
jgi:hypothetical protein